MEAVFSRIIGKFITGTIVVDYNGNKPGFVKILIRSLVRLIPVDWFIFFKANPVGWHDSISKTVVVNKEGIGL